MAWAPSDFLTGGCDGDEVGTMYVGVLSLKVIVEVIENVECRANG